MPHVVPGIVPPLWIDDLMRVTRDADFPDYGDDDVEAPLTLLRSEDLVSSFAPALHLRFNYFALVAR